MGLLQSPALPLGYPATGKGYQYTLIGGVTTETWPRTNKGAFSLVKRIHNAVLEKHLQRADGNLDVDGIGIISPALNDHRLRLLGLPG